MTTATLGLAVQSGSAVTAAADLDKLVASAGRAERSTAGVGRASRDLAGALAPMTALLASIDRNTATLAAGLGRVSVATTQVQRAAVSVSASLTTEANGFRSATEAMRQNTQAANENRAALAARNAVGGSNFNTANVAAQFQDIGVTSAMGMSPLQIALQQGTQLSAVLGGQGLTGVVRTLGAAFASVLSPVSLLTIGAVFLGSTALQALGGMFQGAETATDALERHNDTLDKTLAGYDDVRQAADDALAAALKLPQESAESDLGAQRSAAATTATAALERALELRKEFEAYAGYAEAFMVPADVTASLQAANDVIRDITADSALSRQELDQMHVALTELGNNTADQNIRDIVNEALALVDAARQAFAQVDSLDTALRNIPRDVQIRLQVSQEFNSSMGDLGDLYIDPRDRFEVAREQAKNLADQATATAATYGDLVGVGEEYQRVLASIDAAEAEASAKAGKAGAKAAQKPFDQWGGNVESFQQRIAAQQMEIELLGQSTYEIERQRAAFDLLNQAKQAGIPITSTVTDQINAMSAEYASATVELERQAAAQAAWAADMEFYKGTFSSFFTSFAQGLREGESVWESFGNAATTALDRIADRALSMAADGIFDMLFGALMGGITGGMGGGWGVAGGFGKPGIFGIPGMATGGTVAGAGLSWVGEQGPELLRLPQGAQVIPNGPSMAMAANQNGAPPQINITNNMQVMPGATEEDGAAFARGVSKELRKQLPDAIQAHNRNPLRRAS